MDTLKCSNLKLHINGVLQETTLKESIDQTTVAVEEKRKEDSTQYYPICTAMGKECKGRKRTSDWDNIEEKEPRDTPRLAVITPVPPPQQPKTYKQECFDGMLNSLPSRIIQEIGECEK